VNTPAIIVNVVFRLPTYIVCDTIVMRNVYPGGWLNIQLYRNLMDNGPDLDVTALYRTVLQEIERVRTTSEES
jgi:hypothetical protein